jgi:hypothetical protein
MMSEYSYTSRSNRRVGDSGGDSYQEVRVVHYSRPRDQLVRQLTRLNNKRGIARAQAIRPAPARSGTGSPVR